MDPTRWQQVKQVFWGALDQPTGERMHWLQRQADCDTGLRAMVLAMLENHASDSVDEPGPQLPERVGPYRVEALVARRSTSLVLRGERDDGTFAQTVAIKLLLVPALDSVAQRRFTAERRALGALRHPGICRILDAGYLEAGPPYLVLEWIAGQPLLEYCQGVSLRRKLRLFCELCQAIEAAHAQLIIHRDLKPEHVLITPEGTVKVLDFGIAKLLLSAEAQPDRTLPGTTPLTPAYASPEQWREEPVSAQMDVFSLGVIFFELLAGRHPYGASPARPHEWAERITRGHAVGLRQVAPGMSRDLDAIAAKALAPAERRYGSVRDFRQDIEAFLEQRPVEARGHLWLYRSGLWLQRHAGRFVVGTMALLVVGILSWQSWQANQQRLAEALRARDRAEKLTTRVFAKILESDLPLETRRQYVDVLATEMESFDWSAVPPVEEQRTAKVLTSIAAFYGEGFGTHLDDQGRAERFARRAIDLLARQWRRSATTESGSALMNAYILLGDIRFTAKKYREARETFAEAVKVIDDMPPRIRMMPAVFIGKSVSLSMVGDALLAEGQARQAVAYQQQALAMRESYAETPEGRKDPWTPALLGNVWLSFGQCYEALGQIELALAAYSNSRDFHLRAIQSGDKTLGNTALLGGATAREALARLKKDSKGMHELQRDLKALSEQFPADLNFRRLADRVARKVPEPDKR